MKLMDHQRENVINYMNLCVCIYIHEGDIQCLKGRANETLERHNQAEEDNQEKMASVRRVL